MNDLPCNVVAFYLVVLCLHSIRLDCDVLLKRRLVICKVDISTISHPTDFSSSQKIILQVVERKINKSKRKVLVLRQAIDSIVGKAKNKGIATKNEWIEENSRFNINTATKSSELHGLLLARWSFHAPQLGEKRCVTTQTTAANETTSYLLIKVMGKKRPNFNFLLECCVTRKRNAVREVNKGLQVQLTVVGCDIQALRGV